MKCRTCKKEKPLTSEFWYIDDSCNGRNGWLTQCKACNNAYRKELRRLKTGKPIVPDGMRRCNVCGNTYPLTFEYFYHNYDSRWQTSEFGYYCKTCMAQKANARNKKKRLQIFEYYCGGTPVCQCPGGCTEWRYEFLSIDHIDGGGREHYAKVGVGNAFVNWIIRNGYPEGFRVLCNNCNQALGHYGYCPHERE